MAKTPVSLTPTSSETRFFLRASDSSNSTEIEQSFLHDPIPTFSNGLTTFGYQLALRNRLHDSKLARHGQYDTKSYKPTFVHDCLMLPGSLASVLGKLSSAEIVPRMTPALLPGFRTHVHPTTFEPCLLQSTSPSDYVHGMLIFGQGRNGRDRIHQHYRPYSRRVKASVEIDVWVSISDRHVDCWRLERRKISAHIWLWADVKCAGRRAMSVARAMTPTWTLEGYLAGELTTDTTLQCDAGEVIGDDSSISADSNHYTFIREGQISVLSNCSDTGYETSDSRNPRRVVPRLPAQEIIC